MMEKKYRNILLVLIIGIPILMAVLLLTFNAPVSLEDPQTCNLCHEMKPFVASYLEPGQGSVILKHKSTCLECHTNASIIEARAAVLNEIEAGALNRISGIKLNTTHESLAANCTRCHSVTDFLHAKASLNLSCRDCHWAHRPPLVVKSTNASIIPYGPHRNQSCQNCHSTTFEIPRCTKCHTGHGEQKLENQLCLACHLDPHLPKKPGIPSNNTITNKTVANKSVKFTEKLPLNVCQPCHENQYYEVANSISKHTDMQTCTLCHESHGEKPDCRKCHNFHQTKKHPDFGCYNCHKSMSEVKITCQHCHGTRVHDITAAEAQWNEPQ